MRSITIHKLDDGLDALIRKRAEKEKSSLNRTIKNILEEALRPAEKSGTGKIQDYLDLFGVWSEADAEEFNQATKELREIDPGDWR